MKSRISTIKYTVALTALAGMLIWTYKKKHKLLVRDIKKVYVIIRSLLSIRPFVVRSDLTAPLVGLSEKAGTVNNKTDSERNAKERERWTTVWWLLSEIAHVRCIQGGLLYFYYCNIFWSYFLWKKIKT